MTSRPSNLLSRDPGVVAPTFVARRLGTSKHRNAAPWYVVRWKKRYLQTAATLGSATVATRTSAATVRQSQRDAEERLASIWRCADRDETEQFDVPAARRVPDSDSRRRVRGFAAWARDAGRLISFNLAVAIIHLAVLRWIFLPIGG